MNLLKCGFKSLHGFKATHILHAAYPANDATIQIVIATEECKQDTYALLIYNSTVESNDEVHIGFSSGSGRNYAIPHTEHLANKSNIGVPGVYAYRIDEEKIIDHNSDCGNLTNPTNGIVNYTSTTLGSEANYTCNADCRPQPIYTRVCMKTGRSATWSAEEHSCSDISCGSLCNPKNGWVNISVSSGPKLMANYTCGAGYKIVGGSKRVCEWSGDEPHCEAI